MSMNMTNPRNLKLGRRAFQPDPRTLRLGPYLKTVPPPPRTADWTKGQTSWGMMLNDQLGDCTIAACGHAVQVLTLATDVEVTVSDQVIENEYSWWCGYVPGDPSTDLGGIPTQVLTHWHKHNFNGHKLKAFVAPAVQNFEEIKQSISLFGGVYIGLNISNYLMDNETDPGSTWDVVPDDGGIAGGHAVWCPAYNTNTITCISWGSIYHMTNQFWAKYVDESYTLLDEDFFDAAGLSASGLDFNQLWTDLAAL